MKIYMRFLTIVLFAIGHVITAHALDRLDANTLSECIAKADIIAYGTISEIIQGDKNDIVVMDDFGDLKGVCSKKSIRILFPKYDGWGCIPVRERGTYFFFLKKEQTDSGLYEMFNEHDGVVQYSGPVFGEIITQLGLRDNHKEKPNNRMEPIEKTPGDENEAQGSQAHP